MLRRRAGNVPALLVQRNELLNLYFLKVRKQGKMQKVVCMKIDVSQLPYTGVMDVVRKTRWVVNELVCENGRVVLDCSPV